MSLSTRKVRSVYLITYSQANEAKFPNRESFSEAVRDCFEHGSSNVKVLQWVCSKEEHISGGFHYHLAVKLSSNKRWLGVKTLMQSRHGVVLNFKDCHANYYDAYKYVIKEDAEPYLSENHPDLSSAWTPPTTKATKAKQGGKRRSLKYPSSKDKASSNKKQRRLSNLEFSDFILKNHVKDEIELFSIAKNQKEEGKTDVAEFILNRNPKSLKDIIDSTWKMETASECVERRNKSRIDIINEANSRDCSSDCNGEWFRAAKEVLSSNKINSYVFSSALRELLIKGRGKYRNVMLVGPANCGKTFLLNPLNELFNTFTNPATTSYAWVGAENAEVLFLNDFRWSTEVLAWKEMLLLLEGQTVHLPAPKSHFAKDICFDSDTPIFATGKEPIKFVGKYNLEDHRETEMMSVRWKVFEFQKQIPHNEQKEITSCAKCFSKLVLHGQEEL